MFDRNPEISSSFLLVLELLQNILSELHDVPNIDVASEEGIADFFEALLDGLLINDGGFVELLEGRGDFSAELC